MSDGHEAPAEDPLGDLRAELDAVRHDLGEPLALLDRLLARWPQITQDVKDLAAIDARIALRDRSAESLVGAHVTCDHCGAELTIDRPPAPNDVATVADSPEATP